MRGAFHRGIIPARKLVAVGWDAAVEELPNDSIAIVVKYLSKKLVHLLKDRGNIIVWDTMDERDKKLMTIVKSIPLNLISLMIHSNTETLSRRSHLPTRHRIVHHYSFDPISLPDTREFGVLFCGNSTSKKLSNCHPSVHVLNYSREDSENGNGRLFDFLNKIAQFPFHISVRQCPVKPQTKISLAAKFHACLICNREAGSVPDFLPSDYPYLCGNSKEEARQMVDYAKNTYEGPIYFKALRMMESVLATTNDAAINASYIQIAEELS